MQTRTLGPGTPEVTEIGFGGMPLSLRNRPPEDVATRVIHSALDAGVTLLDTADVYCLDEDDIGHNERLLANALQMWTGSHDALVVATKGGMIRPEGRWERNGRPEHLRVACERSLEALGVERIDLYQLHAPDPAVPFADSVATLAELQQQGKIRWVGISNVAVDQIEMAASIVPILTVQNRLNPFFREAIDTGVVEHCRTEGIGFLAYSPVGGGRLNKKLPSHPTLQPIAQRHGVSTHAVVIAWVMAQAPNVIPLVAGRSVEHALDAVGAADVKLSDDELAAIDAAQFSRA